MTFPFTQLLFNSIIIGSIYALVAVGFSLIFQANRFMHLAHGGVVALGAYLAFMFFTILNLPFFMSALLSMILCALLGYAMYYFLYDNLQKKNSSSIILLLASIALLILIENTLLIAFSSDTKTIKLFAATKGLSIIGATITPLQIIIVVTCLIILALTYCIMNYTAVGRDLRAVSNNPQLSEIMGINKKKFLSLSFVIGSVLAAIAEILIGMEQTMTPSMGTPLMIKGFSGAIIGGVSSIPASIAGSFIVGLAENFGVWWIPSGYKDAITFALLFIFLLIKPNGLFGKELNRT